MGKLGSRLFHRFTAGLVTLIWLHVHSAVCTLQIQILVELQFLSIWFISITFYLQLTSAVEGISENSNTKFIGANDRNKQNK